MWLCPKCGTEVEDSLDLCWICGTSPDGTEYPHIPQAWRASEPLREPPALIEVVRAIKEGLGKRTLPPGAGVPRRFSLGRLMLITAFFAVLFGLLSWLDAPPVVFVVVGVFVTVVGLAQAILYSGKKPRKASVVAGSAVGVVVSMIWCVFLVFAVGGRPRIGGFLCWFPLWIAFCAGVGAVLGYVAGCLIASVFLGKRVDLPEADDRRSETPDPLAPEDPQIGPPEDPPAE